MDLFPCRTLGQTLCDWSWWGMGLSCGVCQGTVRLCHANPLLLDSCCWGCRWSLFKEQCNCSSVWCGHGGLGDGEVYLWGHVEAWGGASYLFGFWWLTLVLLHSAFMASAAGPWAPQQGVTSGPLGNLFPPALCWRWPSLGWRMGLWVPPPLDRDQAVIVTLDAGSDQALA